MPKKITAYQAEDGSIHEDECSAARRDLEAIIQASPLAENGPYAKLLVDWLTDRSDVVLKVLGEYNRACPKNVAEKAPSESVERTRSSSFSDPAHEQHAIFREGYYASSTRAHNPYKDQQSEQFAAWAAGRKAGLAGEPLPEVDYDDSSLRPRNR